MCDSDREFARFQFRRIFGDKISDPSQYCHEYNSFDDAFVGICKDTYPISNPDIPQTGDSGDPTTENYTDILQNIVFQKTDSRNRHPQEYKISLLGLSPSGVWSVILRYISSFIIGNSYKVIVSIAEDSRNETETQKIIGIVNDFFEQVCGCDRAEPRKGENLTMTFHIDHFNPGRH